MPWTEELARALRELEGLLDALGVRVQTFRAATEALDQADEAEPWAFAGWDDELWHFGPAARRGLAALYAAAREGEEPDYVARDRLANHARYILAFHQLGGAPGQGCADRLAAGVFLYLAGLAVGRKGTEDYLWPLAGCALVASELAQFEEQAGTAAATAAIRALGAGAEAGGAAVTPAVAAEYGKRCGGELDDGLRIAQSEESFFAALDYAWRGMSPVKAAVERGDYAQARRAYLARLRENRLLQELREQWEELRPAVDLEEAERACRNIFTLRAHMLITHDFGERIDWTTVLDGDIESNVALNSHAMLGVLLGAYCETGEEKYLEHLVRIFRSWVEQSPAPDVRSGKQWRTLECGSRTCRLWPYILAVGMENELFCEQAAFDMARSFFEHALYLACFTARGGNWFQVETSGLGVCALLFPEWRISGELWQLALRRIYWATLDYFFPSGFQTEGSATYHEFPTSAQFALFTLAQRAGKKLPEELLERFRAAHEVYIRMAQPDMALPLFNDNNPQYVDVRAALRRGLRLFDDKRFRWFATGGSEGSPPEFTSTYFDDMGYAVMRDGWGSDDLVLFFDGGYYGSGHQHEDKLSFILFGYGRLLLSDQNIYRYRRDEMELYFRHTRAHNTVVVDERSQARFLTDAARWEKDPDLRFVTCAQFDYVHGAYRDGYAHRTHDRAADERSLVRDIVHVRTIYHPRGGPFFLRDNIEGAGEHKVEQIFHLAPVIESWSAEGIRAGEYEVLEGNVVRSANEGVANVAIVPVPPHPGVVRVETGQRKPVRGWFALYGEHPAHDVTYEAQAELPLALDVVLWPQRPGERALPEVERAPIEFEAGRAGCAYRVVLPGRVEFLAMADGESAAEFRSGPLHARAQLVHITLTPQGEPTFVRAIRPVFVTWNGTPLVEQATAPETYAAELGGKE